MADNIGALVATITASDKTDAGVASAKAKLGSLATASRSIGEVFSALTGSKAFAPLTTTLSTARSHVSTLASTITSAAVPLSGAGLVGGAVAATTSFVSTGKALLRGARDLGMSVPDLHAFRNAAALAGVDASDATDGMRSFGTAIYDAVGGRNAEALSASMLPRLGFSLRNAAGGAKTANEALGDLADRVQMLNADPRSQLAFVRAFGAEELLPLLRKGRDGLDDWLRRGRDVGTMTQEQAEQAKRLAEQWTGLRVQADTLTTTIGGALEPALSRGMSATEGWVKANEKWLSTEVATRVSQVATGTAGLASAIDTVVVKTVGWQNATSLLELLLVNRLLKAITGVNVAMSAMKAPAWLLRLMGFSASAATAGTAVGATMLAAGAEAGRQNLPMLDDLGRPVGNWGGEEGEKNRAKTESAAQPQSGVTPQSGQALSTGEVRNRVQQATDFFLSQGWERHQAIGLATNFRAESDMDERKTHDGGIGFGIAGWNKQRLENLGAFIGRDPRTATFQEQLRFAQHELTAGSEQAAGNSLRRTTNAAQAADVVAREYERPKYVDRDARNRAFEAADWDRNLRAGPPSVPSPAAPTTPTPSPAPVASPLDGDAGRAAQNGTVSVNVRLTGAPRGTVAEARSDGIARADPPLVETALPGYSPR